MLSIHLFHLDLFHLDNDLCRSWRSREHLGMLWKQKPQSLRNSGSNSRLTLRKEKGLLHFFTPLKYISTLSQIYLKLKADFAERKRFVALFHSTGKAKSTANYETQSIGFQRHPSFPMKSIGFQRHPSNSNEIHWILMTNNSKNISSVCATPC